MIISEILNMKFFFLFFLSSAFFISGAQQADILIRNGRILDGTGNSWYYGDVAVKDGKIIAVGKVDNMDAIKIIDANKRIVSPGFIDVHGHIETGIMEKPTADNYVHDGVTTVITGNCGGSALNIRDFFRRVDSARPSINIATLIGHNTVREQVMRREKREPSVAEQKQMEALVEKAMEDGAVGFSTGLIYIPGTYAKTDEVIGMAKSAAKHQGIYASHIRDEENKVVDAIQEAINIGKQAQIPVQISHFKVSGRANWGRSNITLGLIKQARDDGWEVTIDQYPYTASSTNLGVTLPDWAFAGGNDSLKARLQNPVVRSQIQKEMLQQLKDFKYKNYSYAVVANYPKDSTLNGKSISEINKLKNRKPKPRYEAETIIEMVEQGGAQMVYHSMNEKDVRNIMQYPFALVGADAGVPIPGKSMPHPRAYGTNARILGRYVRDEKIITLEEAVRRMTSLAAQKFGLKDRGLIKEGMAADILVFDEKRVQDLSTFEKPHQYSKGFDFVIINGAVVVENEVHLGTRSGKALHGPAMASTKTF